MRSGSSAASWSAAPIARAHLRPLLDDVEAGDARRAGGRRQQRRQHVHRRRLAGAVRAEEAVDLAGLDARSIPSTARHVLEGADESPTSMPCVVAPRFRLPAANRDYSEPCERADVSGKPGGAGICQLRSAPTRPSSRGLDRELVADHGLTINDYEVLLRLARAPDRMMRRVDLAQQVLLTPSGITRLLDGLQRPASSRRPPATADARVVYAKLTDAGRREAQERHGRPRREHLRAVRRALHRGRARQLVRLPRAAQPKPEAETAD